MIRDGLGRGCAFRFTGQWTARRVALMFKASKDLSLSVFHSAESSVCVWPVEELIKVW